MGYGIRVLDGETYRERIINMEFDQLKERVYDKKAVETLERIQNFILTHSNIHNVSFVSKDLLWRYIEVQTLGGATISEAVKDIKLFLNALHNSPFPTNLTKSDFSIQNYQLWKQLQKVSN